MLTYRDVGTGLAEVFSRLPGTGITHIGEFRYGRQGQGFSVTSATSHTVVALTPGGVWKAEEFHYLAMNFEGRQIWTAHTGKEVWCEDVARARYPRYQFHWHQNAGDLCFTRVDLDGTTFANYYRKASPFFRGQAELLIQCPDKLEGMRRLIGREIEWQIDFATREDWIIRQSRILEFFAAVKASG